MRKITCQIVLVLALFGCKVPVDPSIQAALAHDYTLPLSAGCETLPGRGMDICRVVEGAQVAEEITVVIPKVKAVSGELRVRYKGVVKSYAITETITRIPWKDLLGHSNYEREDEGPASLIGSLRLKMDDGERFTDLLGYAYLVVLGPGYSPMPIDSDSAAFGTTCRIQVSTSGRSALECE